jgi:hypothetical protein
MFHITCQEWIRVLFENAQAGASAEIKALSMIDGAWIVFRVFDNTSTDGFIFRQWSWGGLCQIFEILSEFM